MLTASTSPHEDLLARQIAHLVRTGQFGRGFGFRPHLEPPSGDLARDLAGRARERQTRRPVEADMHLAMATDRPGDLDLRRHVLHELVERQPFGEVLRPTLPAGGQELFGPSPGEPLAQPPGAFPVPVRDLAVLFPEGLGQVGRHIGGGSVHFKGEQLAPAAHHEEVREPPGRIDQRCRRGERTDVQPSVACPDGPAPVVADRVAAADVPEQPDLSGRRPDQEVVSSRGVPVDDRGIGPVAEVD